MRFFFRKKDETRPSETNKQQQAAYKVSMTEHGYDDLRKCDVTLKVWLPEAVEKQLGELTAYLNTSLSDLIRQILFQHLYGRYDLIGLVERQKFNPEGDPYSGVRFSIAKSQRGTQPPPAPKIAGVKVFIPERMRKDLEGVAGAKYQTISEYVRQVILVHLFGVLHSTGVLMTPPNNVMDGIA